MVKMVYSLTISYNSWFLKALKTTCTQIYTENYLQMYKNHDKKYRNVLCLNYSVK